MIRGSDTCRRHKPVKQNLCLCSEDYIVMILTRNIKKKASKAYYFLIVGSTKQYNLYNMTNQHFDAVIEE